MKIKKIWLIRKLTLEEDLIHEIVLKQNMIAYQKQIKTKLYYKLLV
jgi:hypothetical protein